MIFSFARVLRRLAFAVFLVACARSAFMTTAIAQTGADTTAIVNVARRLSADSMRGRGPWSPEAERAARWLAGELGRLGARPVFGNTLLVPFATKDRPSDTLHNVVAVLPARGGSTTGEVIGITAHLDHLGVGQPDARGDSIYNGFLDDALGIGMILDVARRYVQSPGDRPLVVMFFNLEEQGLLGSKALLERPDAKDLLSRMRLLIGVDAGSPAGEATEWQLMGALPAPDIARMYPSNGGATIAESLARARGWTTIATAARPINDVFLFWQRGVPILFPIPGKTWKGYTEAQRAEAMRKFDHYHQPSDEFRPDFPLVGTAYFADWLWSIVRTASER